jgi:hypothetical protein
VRDFLVALGPDLTTRLGSATKHVEALSAAIERLNAHVVEQDQSTRARSSGARRCQELAEELRGEFIRPVSEMGGLLFEKEPSVKRSLRMPQVFDYERIIQSALSIAGHAEQQKEKFVNAGFGDDFVDRIRTAAEGFRKEVDAKNAHIGRRSAATAGVKAEYASARKIVRLLHTMLAPRWKDMPERLAQWNTLSRFVRSTQPEEVAGTTTPVTPLPVTPVAPLAVVPPGEGGVAPARVA